MKSTPARFSWAPIRKLVVGAASYGVILAARKLLHLDLGPDGVADVVNGLVGFGAAYAVRDARVRSAAEAAQRSKLAGELEELILSHAHLALSGKPAKGARGKRAR